MDVRLGDVRDLQIRGGGRLDVLSASRIGSTTIAERDSAHPIR